MFKKILFVSTLLFGILYASGNPVGGGTPSVTTTGGCGATYGALGDFYNIFERVKNNNLSSARQTFNGFKCGADTDPNSGLIKVITDIDFATGEYSCGMIDNNFNLDNKDTQKINIETVRYKNIQCLEDVKKIYDNYNSQVEIKPAKVFETDYILDTDYGEEYIGFLSIGKIKDTWYRIGDTRITSTFKINYGDYQKSIDEIKEKIEDIRTTATLDKIDTQSQNFPTYSEYFTGILTLNSDYFKEETLNPTTGEIQLQGDDTFFVTEESDSWFSTDSQYKRMFKKLSSIFDAKTWGFYVAFIENMRNAETYVILFFFGIGFFGLVGQKMFQSGYSSFWKDDSREDLKLKKLVAAPLIMLAVFTAPIVPSQLTIDKKFLNETKEINAGIVLNNSAGSPTAIDENIQNSTIIQSAIRYFAHFGVIAANKFADYALYPYLNYLQSKIGNGYEDMIENYEDFAKTSQERLLILQKQFEFFQYFCRPIYEASEDKLHNRKTLKINNLLLGDYKDITNMWKLTMKQHATAKEVLNKNNIGADIISAQACSKIINEINKNSNIVFEYAENFLSLETFAKHFNPDNVNSVNTIIKRSQNNQKKFGWIYSSIVPGTYTMLFASQLGDTIESKQAAIDVMSSAPQLDSVAVEVDVTEEEKEKDSVILEFVSKHTAYLSHFIMPGFDKIFLFFYNAGEAVIDKFIKVSSFILTFGTGGILTVVTKISWKALGGSVIAKGAMAIAAFWLAVMVYDFFLRCLSLAFILMMLVYKIAFYFIQIMLFFVASPVVVIWSVIQNKAEVIWHYIGKGLIITIMPILIVIGCYSFVFCQEILISLQAIVIGLFKNTFVNEASTFGTVFTLSTVLLLTTALLQLILIIAGYVTIVQFPKWFLETIGAKGVDNLEQSIANFQEKTIHHLKSPV